MRRRSSATRRSVSCSARPTRASSVSTRSRRARTASPASLGVASSSSATGMRCSREAVAHPVRDEQARRRRAAVHGSHMRIGRSTARLSAARNVVGVERAAGLARGAEDRDRRDDEREGHDRPPAAHREGQPGDRAARVGDRVHALVAEAQRRDGHQHDRGRDARQGIGPRGIALQPGDHPAEGRPRRAGRIRPRAVPAVRHATYGGRAARSSGRGDRDRAAPCGSRAENTLDRSLTAASRELTGAQPEAVLDRRHDRRRVVRDVVDDEVVAQARREHERRDPRARAHVVVRRRASRPGPAARRDPTGRRTRRR